MTVEPGAVALPPSADVDAAPLGEVRKKLMFLPGLEGLHGVALIIELFAHTGIFLVQGAEYWLFPGGLIAMSLFFSLSGFLITALLLIEYDKHGHIDIPRFFRKRARRLFPPMLLMLALHWLLVLYYHRPTGLEWRQDVWAVTMAINYKYSVHGNDPLMGIDVKILWSLAIEGQFYLFWPFLFIALKKYAKSLKRVALSLVALIMLFTVVRASEYHIWGDWKAVYFRTEGRLDAFFIGALLAFLWYYDVLPMKRIKQGVWVAWAVFIAGLWFVRFGDAYIYSWGLLMFNVCAAFIIAACFDNNFVISRFLSTRPLRLTGRVSYSFYVIHIQVFFWVALQRSYLSGVQRVALAWAGTLVFGTICYLIAERPLLGRPPLRIKKPTPLTAANE